MYQHSRTCRDLNSGLLKSTGSDLLAVLSAAKYFPTGRASEIPTLTSLRKASRNPGANLKPEAKFFRKSRKTDEKPWLASWRRTRKAFGMSMLGGNHLTRMSTAESCDLTDAIQTPQKNKYSTKGLGLQCLISRSRTTITSSWLPSFHAMYM